MAAFTSFLQTVLGGAWELFSIKVPGFPFSYADIIIAGLIVSGGWAVLRIAMGFGGGLESQGRTSRNPKISKERKNDEK